MYNGIGLTTPRGTGTSGYVQKNFAAARKPRSNQEVKTRDAQPPKKANEDILEHERRRKVEVAVAELEEELVERGYTDERIRRHVESLRRRMAGDVETVKDQMLRKSDRHRIAERKQEETETMRRALRVDENYEEGGAFRRAEKQGAEVAPEEDQEARAKRDNESSDLVRKRGSLSSASGSEASSSSSSASSSSSSSALSTDGKGAEHKESNAGVGNREERKPVQGLVPERNDSPSVESEKRSARREQSPEHRSKARSRSEDRDQRRSRDRSETSPTAKSRARRLEKPMDSAENGDRSKRSRIGDASVHPAAVKKVREPSLEDGAGPGPVISSKATASEKKGNGRQGSPGPARMPPKRDPPGSPSNDGGRHGQRSRDPQDRDDGRNVTYGRDRVRARDEDGNRAPDRDHDHQGRDKSDHRNGHGTDAIGYGRQEQSRQERSPDRHRSASPERRQDSRPVREWNRPRYRRMGDRQVGRSDQRRSRDVGHGPYRRGERFRRDDRRNYRDRGRSRSLLHRRTTRRSPSLSRSRSRSRSPSGSRSRSVSGTRRSPSPVRWSGRRADRRGSRGFRDRCRRRRSPSSSRSYSRSSSSSYSRSSRSSSRDSSLSSHSSSSSSSSK